MMREFRERPPDASLGRRDELSAVGEPEPMFRCSEVMDRWVVGVFAQSRGLPEGLSGSAAHPSRDVATYLAASELLLEILVVENLRLSRFSVGRMRVGLTDPTQRSREWRSVDSHSQVEHRVNLSGEAGGTAFVRAIRPAA